jgi:hypothetical protein
MFTLKIELGNDAMRTPADVADALMDLVAILRFAGPYRDSGGVRDRNGNGVGKWEYRP